jgi:glyoxylase-like metal-dependent hydrolase (beta-lactamase superfamily II)
MGDIDMKLKAISVGYLGTNCYFLASDAKNCAVIDPGAQPEKLLDYISGEKLVPKYVLITHGHHDHTGAVERLVSEFPEARLLIGKNDLEMLKGGCKSLAGTVSDSDKLELDELVIEVLETPGHTRGGVCYLCEGQMFSGDTLFDGDVGRCDLAGGDYSVMKKSLRKLCALEGDYRVYPGHGGSTSLERERAVNPYIKEALMEA